jgi:hypothetical protein
MNYLPRLSSNSDPPDLCLLGRFDYRCEHWCPALRILNSVQLGALYFPFVNPTSYTALLILAFTPGRRKPLKGRLVSRADLDRAGWGRGGGDSGWEGVRLLP